MHLSARFYFFSYSNIILSRRQHGSPWPSLATRLYRPSLPRGLPGYILYRHRLVLYRFLLAVLPLLVHVKGSTGVYHLRVHPYFCSISVLSNFDSFRDGLLVVAVQLLFYGVLPPEFVQYCSQHSCVIAVNFFSIRLVSIHVVHPYSRIDNSVAWKKLRFILSVMSDFYMTAYRGISLFLSKCIYGHLQTVPLSHNS